MNTLEQTVVPEFKIPEHLYVPSPPLWIESQTFRGPLDLLLYLIREQNLDILDIPMALIAAQYLEYLKLMQSSRFEIAPDYLLMAVRLLQIKSQCLLPKPPTAEAEDLDPRAELVKQLCAYEKFKNLALFLDALPRWERDLWPLQLQLESMPAPPIELKLAELKLAYANLKKTQNFKISHQVEPGLVYLSDKMAEILVQLQANTAQHFYQLLKPRTQALEMIVSFQAILELAKNSQIFLEQPEWQALLWVSLQGEQPCSI